MYITVAKGYLTYFMIHTAYYNTTVFNTTFLYILIITKFKVAVHTTKIKIWPN